MKNRIKSLICCLSVAAVIAVGTASSFTASAASPRGNYSSRVAASPVKEFCSIIDNATGKFSRCTSLAQFERVATQLGSIEGNLDGSYRLRASDRPAIKRSLNGFMSMMMAKARQFSGIDNSEYEDMVRDVIDELVDESYTLEDVGVNFADLLDALS